MWMLWIVFVSRLSGIWVFADLFCKLEKGRLRPGRGVDMMAENPMFLTNGLMRAESRM